MIFEKSPFRRFLLMAFAWLLISCAQEPTLTPILEAPDADKAYYQKLLSLVQNQINTAPEDVALRIKMANYHQNLSWPEESAENMQTLLKLAPKEPQVMMLAADYYINQEDFEKSWIYAQQASKLGSVHPSLSLIQAKYFLSRRNFKEASRFLEHYFSQGGTLPEAYVVGSELALQNGDTTKSKAILENGVVYNPANVRLISSLSDVYAATGEAEAQKELIESYQSKTNDRETFRLELLNAYFGLEAFAQASGLAHNWPGEEETGFFQYGLLFLETPLIDSANYYADQILTADSANTQGMLLKARFLSKRGRLSESNKFYTTLLEIDPSNQIAQEERRIVIGKIAYLRKIREEKASIPTFDFTPKKSND